MRRGNSFYLWEALFRDPELNKKGDGKWSNLIPLPDWEPQQPLPLLTCLGWVFLPQPQGKKPEHLLTGLDSAGVAEQRSESVKASH